MLLDGAGVAVCLVTGHLHTGHGSEGAEVGHHHAATIRAEVVDGIEQGILCHDDGGLWHCCRLCRIRYDGIFLDDVATNNLQLIDLCFVLIETENVRAFQIGHCPFDYLVNHDNSFLIEN